VPFLLAERARRSCARSMRAGKGSLTIPSVSGNKRENRRPSHGLVARLGVPVGGWVRMPRAGGTVSHLFREKQASLDESSIGKVLVRYAQ
jgi:hypothetical protein